MAFTTLCTNWKRCRFFVEKIQTDAKEWLKTLQKSKNRLKDNFLALKQISFVLSYFLTRKVTTLYWRYLFLFAIAVFLRLIFLNGPQEKGNFWAQAKIIGGPERQTALLTPNSFITAQPEVQNQQSPFSHFTYYYSSSHAVFGFPTVQSEKVSDDVAEPYSFSSPILIYQVQENDTLQSVADRFKITIDTIVQANDLKSVYLDPGQKLIILPVSGVFHEVRSGENLFSIAEQYRVSASRISMLNGLGEDEPLVAGEKLIIPGAVPKEKLSFSNPNPQFGSKQDMLRMPTIGWNWGRLHNYNAVDIANKCGTPVYASASGFVENTQSEGWNNGYGSFITIRHAAGVRTVYAHLSAVFVSAGAYVNQGDLIGAIGKSGKVDGASGCHLHFEVHGAENPFTKN